MPDSRNTGVIFNIQRYSVHDGPGIRTTIFFKGCPLRCWWCHNPESQRSGPEEIFGKTMTVQEVMAEIAKDVLFFDESGGGVTFSGGEPLAQPEFLAALLACCKRQDIHTALDTSGFAAPEVFQALIDLVDVFLYDLKIVAEAAHCRYTGVSNQPILENLRALAERGKPIWLRWPVIPQITDTPSNIMDMLALLTDIKKSIRQINLLPYHQTAVGKYVKLGKENNLAGIRPPAEEQLQTLQQIFAQQGFQVKIGG